MFLFYAKCPKGDDEKIMCQIVIKPGVGVQVTVRSPAAQNGKDYVCGLAMSGINFLLNARV